MNNKQCPEFPFFGAGYPDARCIDGYLQDLDKCDENGDFYGDRETPCPFCNTEKFIEEDPLGVEERLLRSMLSDEPDAKEIKKCEEQAKKAVRSWYIQQIEYTRKLWAK